ncbi:MAG TPA: hypothetical protein VMF32_09930 [Xanthobacteraceae bacterium]|nr:hypothetical protein [Xanthobacteraceae bacterium]
MRTERLRANSNRKINRRSGIVASSFFAAIILLSPSAGHCDPRLQDSIESDWVDLGHWQWPQRDFSTQQGEVYYSPSTIFTEPRDAVGVVRRVLIKIEWGYTSDMGRQGYDASGEDFSSSAFWEIGIFCSYNEYGRVRMIYTGERSFRHDASEGPFALKSGSVAMALRGILCG